MSAETQRVARLRELGQSVWLDQISRDLIRSGELERLVEQGVAGVTTNPSIFEKALGEGDAYDADVARFAAAGSTAQRILERLLVADVQAACDILAPVYEASERLDGYVSIEVPPALAYDTEATMVEAKRIWATVERPNVMVKIPGTKEGLPAIRACLSAGLNINVTLMFSMAHYETVVEAFLDALEDRRARHLPLPGVASVASFFVSRLDTLADKVIDERLAGESSDDARAGLASLKGRLAVANCRLVYARFAEIFAAERWRPLGDDGAGVQRVLWASTSTKNPDYSDLLYVDTLIGPRTVNTLPLSTLSAFVDHGATRSTVQDDVAGARLAFETAARLGLDMAALTEKLQVDGVAAFQKSYDSLLAMVDDKRGRASAG